MYCYAMNKICTLINFAINKIVSHYPDRLYREHTTSVAIQKDNMMNYV